MATLPVTRHRAQMLLHGPKPVGADIVLRVLEAHGIEVVFGMPGGAVLPLYDAIARGTSLTHVLVRHEQGAGHMAQGYARASGRPGVTIATSGPGATNLVTPIADARMDSTPLICITGQVSRAVIGTMAFQECDIVSVVKPLVKGAWQVREVDEIAETLTAAIALATDGRPGPVLVDIPRDLQEAICESIVRPAAGSESDRLRRRCAPVDGSSKHPTWQQAVEMIRQSERPVVYAGGGAQGSSGALLALAEAGTLPVVTTLLGKGAFPDSHPLFVGWPGMHGTRAANLALYEADLIIAAGARFDDRVTGRTDAFAPDARVIHIDIDPGEHGKIRQADVPIEGTLDEVLEGLSQMLSSGPGRAEWLARLRDWDERFPLAHASPGAVLKPQMVLQRLDKLTRGRPDVIWTTGVGQHQMWAMQYLQVDLPRRFITSGGHGTMGFGLPAAIGAKLARPGADVICIDGDGSFQMTIQELATAVALELPVIIVIINNGHLGMVRQWQSMFYGGRLSDVDLAPGMPRFAAIARAFGGRGFEVRNLDQLDAAFEQALCGVGPAVLDVLVEPTEDCFPMIVPGGAASEQLEFTQAR